MRETKTEAAKSGEIKPRRKFDAMFKREAVALWLKSGKSARQISAELGITQNHLFDWKNAYGPVPPASEAQKDTELAALRRENALLRQQRDILKKTLGIVFEGPNNDTNGSKP
jgi:transposase-like protein